MINKIRVDHLEIAPVANTSMKMTMMGVNTGNLGIPNIGVGSMPSITGIPSVSNPSTDVQETFNFKEDVSKLSGKHAFKMGYDLVTFSGGKGIMGPQSAGLLLGRKDLIEAARLNTSPYSDSVARGMKVNKEMVYSRGVKGACSTDKPMHLISLGKQELRKVRTILSSYAGDKRPRAHFNPQNYLIILPSRTFTTRPPK
jgi:hypothetical protein